MIHLRIVAPEDAAHSVLDLLCASPAVINVVHLRGASKKPKGDVVLCDVAREEASVILSDLKELDIPRLGSIAVEHIDTSISDAAKAAEKAAPGLPSDAVVWEEVEARTSEQTELSVSFVLFMVAAMQIAAVGFPIGIVMALLTSLLFIGVDVFPQDFSQAQHPFTEFISEPDFLSFFVAFVAGSAGVLSLTSAKSGALVGVLISVTTIPAASNVGVAAAYGQWGDAKGAAIQLAVNLAGIVASGVLTLFVQRRYYVVRRRKHLMDPVRTEAGLPLGRSLRGTTEVPGWEDRQKKEP